MRGTLPIAFFLPLAVFVYACEDDSGSGATGTFDAGTGTFEAGTNPPNPDAAPPNEAGGKGLVVNVKSMGAAVANVAVLFHDATGAVTSQAKTDATGVTSAETAPAMATIAVPRPDGSGALLTYLGLVEGDVLNVEVAPTLVGEPPQVGTFSVTFTNAAPNATLHEVQVNGRCFGSTGPTPTQPIVVSLSQACLKQPNNVLLATAFDDGDVPLQFTFKRGEPSPAMNANRDVLLPIWAAPATIAVTATNTGPEAAISGEVTQISDGAPVVVGQNPTGDFLGAGASFRYANGFAEALQVKVRSELDSSTQLVLRRAAPSDKATVDFATALPRLTGLTATGATRPDVTVTSAGSLASSDGGFVSLRWSKLTGGENFIDFSWSFVLPPATTSFKAPALPAELAALAPPAESASGAGFFESDAVQGYAQLKAAIVPVSGIPPYFDERGVLPTNGTTRITLHNGLDFAP